MSNQPPRPAPSARRRPSPTLWMLALLSMVAEMATTVRTRAETARGDERGNVITDNLAWIVFGVITIVVIGALVKTLGSNVVNWVQKQLGV